jgi:uncharacterized membrane protein
LSESPEILDENEKLSKITKIVLIFGIVLTTSFIMYDLLRPKEPYILFSLENEEGNLGDYTNNVTIGTPVQFKINVTNRMDTDINVSITIHKGDNSTSVSRTGGFQNSTLVSNISLEIKKDEQYSSDLIEVVFDEAGSNMITGAQLNLFNETTQEYEYMEGYVVYLRVNVHE